MANKDYTDVLLEDINGKFDFLVDAVSGMQANVKMIPDIAERVEKIEDDVKVIKLVVTETNKDLRNHEKRITKLEAAPQS